MGIEGLFLGSVSVFVYVYFLYPIILMIVDKLHHGEPLKAPRFLKKIRERIESKSLLRLKHGYPSVTVIVPCYNERDAVQQKIANLKALHYPKEKMHFLFVDDMSDDGTRDYLQHCTDEQVTVHLNQTRLGKLGGMRAAAATVHTDLLLFSDCAAQINPGAVKRMVHFFRNSATGLVTGIYKVVPIEKTARTNGEGLYWRYEMAIRHMESHLRTTTHATGSLFMVRQKLFENIQWRDGIINDDFFIPLSVIEMGFDVHSEAKAVATEYVETNVAGEFRRRSRIASGNFQMISEVLPLLRSHRFFTLFQLISHKLLRNFAGLLLPIVFVSNLLLALKSPVYGGVMALQMLFYLVALLGMTEIGKRGKLKKATAIPLYFVATNVASAWGFALIVSKKQSNVWNSTDQVYGGSYGVSRN